jgi:hypothetical protein
MDEPFSEVHGHLRGAAADFFEQARKISEFLSNVIEQNPVDGNFELKLVLVLPGNFAENMNMATERAVAAIRRFH